MLKLSLALKQISESVDIPNAEITHTAAAAAAVTNGANPACFIGIFKFAKYICVLCVVRCEKRFMCSA